MAPNTRGRKIVRENARWRGRTPPPRVSSRAFITLRIRDSARRTLTAGHIREILPGIRRRVKRESRGNVVSEDVHCVLRACSRTVSSLDNICRVILTQSLPTIYGRNRITFSGYSYFFLFRCLYKSFIIAYKLYITYKYNLKESKYLNI